MTRLQACSLIFGLRVVIWLGVRPQVTGELSKGMTKICKIALWIQSEKDNPKFPDLKGNVNVGGDKTYVSAWLHGYKLVPLVESEDE